jgi:fatty acid desaturase
VIWTFIVQQHAGLDRDVNDHRLTTRSFRFGPVLSFFVMNMENHIEHHLYPLVPFHALPALHRRVEKELPVPYRGLCPSFFEMLSVLLRQFKDPEVCIKRPLPATTVAPSTESGVKK